jgi:predicted CoA-binding protein
MPDWRDNILENEARIGELIRATRRVAVLGIKTEAQADQPAYYVPRYLADQGVEVVPVPVYYPEAKEIMGRQVYRKVADIPGPVDIVQIFRRPADIPGHVGDIRAKRPGAVWMQLGIRNAEAAETLARDGILVVQDRCLMVEWKRNAGKAAH